MIPMAKPLIGKEEIQVVKNVMKSGIFVNGPNVEQFGNEFASYIKVKYGIPTSSGTTALHTALLAAGICSGDEVIVPAFSFFSTASVVYHCGATPVFADIHPDTFDIMYDDVVEKITSKTRAIIPVHMFGQVCRDIMPLRDVCEDKGLFLIEDACQAHGAEQLNLKAGSFGDMAAFSFYPTKNMTTGGDGGMVVTNDDRLSTSCARIINHGQFKKYYHTTIGFNYRMSEISAAIGRVQLSKLDSMNEERIRNARYYNMNLPSCVKKPSVFSWNKHVYHQYVIMSEFRNDLMRHLYERGIETSVHYPLPLNMQPAFLKESGRATVYENAKKVTDCVLSLPVHPGLTMDDLKYICDQIGTVM